MSKTTKRNVRFDRTRLYAYKIRKIKITVPNETDRSAWLRDYFFGITCMQLSMDYQVFPHGQAEIRRGQERITDIVRLSNSSNLDVDACLSAKVFNISLVLSRLLQTWNIDSVKAECHSQINVRVYQKNTINHSDQRFEKPFEDLEEKCLSLEIEISFYLV